jgi:ADP-heptose:LPS heptosyltransferase/GT2 family glycosyltransferase
MRITVSTLLFYKPELCRDFIQSILPGLIQYASQNNSEIDFVISDNTPADQSILSEIEPALKKAETKTLKFKTYQNEFNLGFGASHNRVFAESNSDIFIVLNNDVFIPNKADEKSWIQKICEPFLKNDRCALVGVSNSPSVLNSEAEGRWMDAEHPEPDYAEGSILAVRTSVAKILGLFAPDLEIAYFEDSDLALRFRQSNYDFELIDLPHEHRRGSSSKLVDVDLLTSIRAKNKSRFLSRWKNYLERRTFTNQIFLDFTSGGWGDVVAALPVVTGLLRDHPTAIIELQTNHSGLKNIFSFPRVTVITENFSTAWQAIESKQYDRVFSLSEVNYTSNLNLGMEIAQKCGLEFDLELPRKHLLAKTLESSPEIKQIFSRTSNICIVHVKSIRADWQGRSLTGEALVESLNYLKNLGYFLVLVGGDNDLAIRETCSLDLTGKTTLEDIFCLLKGAKLFFGMDSGPLHVAQLFKVPTFAVFGATLPSSRLTEMINSYGYIVPGLDCIACYQRHIPSSVNYCIRRDEACVKKIDAKDLRSKLELFLKNDFCIANPTASFFEQKVLMEKALLAVSSLPASFPDLSEARLRQLVVALAKKILHMLRERLGLK